MAKTPIAFNNSGSPIPNTEQVGNLAIGSESNRYDTNPGDVQWWMGPDQDLGYVVAKPISAGRPSGAGTTYVAFNRSDLLTDASFKLLAENLAGQSFSSATDAKTWLNTNGYWTSWSPSFANTAQFFYDPSNRSSYPEIGTTLTNIGTLGDITGTRGTLSGIIYNNALAGGVFDFDGGSDTISFGNYNFGNTMTVNCWVYPQTEYSINCLMSNAGANTSTNGFKIGWNNWNTTNLTMNFEAGNGSSGGTQSTAINTVTEGSWQMITYVFDKISRTIKFYRNAVEIATASGGTPVANISTNNANWWMGSIGGNSYYMEAYVGQFKIWTSLRTQSEIQSEFDNIKSKYGL